MATFLPTGQAAQITAAIRAQDELCTAVSWDNLEALLRTRPLSVVVFDPAAGGMSDTASARKLVRSYPSIPFVAYVPLDACFVGAIALLANDGLQEVVVYRANDSPMRFRKLLDRVSSMPQVTLLTERMQPWFRRMPHSLVTVLTDDLRNPDKYASAEDLARAAGLTVSALYRSFKKAKLNSPKSFVVGARVFRGYLSLRDAASSITDVSMKMGYSQPRIFARHFSAALGGCPSRVRNSLDQAEAVTKLVSWLGAEKSTSTRRPKHQMVKLACVLPFALAAACWGPEPGQGPKAEAGYQRAAPVISALERYRASSGTLPDSLPQLVPEFLPASALSVPTDPQERYPLEYRRDSSTFVLGFRYAGPGINRCRYDSRVASWRCSGHY